MDYLKLAPVTLAADKAGLAAGTTTTLTSANAIDYSIDGKAFAKAISSNEATPTLDAVTGVAFLPVPTSKGSIFTINRDAAGALKVVQGSIEALDAQNQFINAPKYGPLGAGLCPYGYILVKVGSTGSPWTFGVSNLAGPPTGVVFTFVDCFTLPARSL